MEFNTIKRGAKRSANTPEEVYRIIDAGCIAQVGFVWQNQAMQLPTAYGRENDSLYLHGALNNHMLQALLNGQKVCVCISFLDGIVAAKNLFHSSVNYRSVVLFGAVSEVTDFKEKAHALACISDQVLPGRSKEVPLGSEANIRNTLVVKFTIEQASAKIRTGGPMKDEDEINNAWSGHLPLVPLALKPVADTKWGATPPLSPSVQAFIDRYNGKE